MTTIANDDYRVEAAGHGGFKVYQNTPVTIRVMEGDGQGGVSVSQGVPYAELFGCSEPDIFNCYYEGDDLWCTDIHCGAQRWRGSKTTREIRAALRKCGFDKSQIDDIIKEYRK